MVTIRRGITTIITTTATIIIIIIIIIIVILTVIVINVLIVVSMCWLFPPSALSTDSPEKRTRTNCICELHLKFNVAAPKFDTDP